MSAKFLLIGLSALALSSCTTWDLRELRSVEPTGNTYQKELAKLYLEYAEAEALNCDWVDSQYFARKGLMVAYGKDVEPEDPKNWKIKEVHHAELLEARKTMDMAFSTPAFKLNPKAAAAVVVNYDAWIENLEEASDEGEIEEARNKFYESLSQLYGRPESSNATPSPEYEVESDDSEKIIKETAKTKAKPKPLTVDESKNTNIEQDVYGLSNNAMPEETITYTIYFDHNSDLVSSNAKKILKSIADSLTDIGSGYEVVINGHTDRSGSDEYNMNLGLKRATKVKDTLVAEGVIEKNINLFSFGESDPKVKTKDGVRNETNRRVEIFIEE